MTEIRSGDYEIVDSGLAHLLADEESEIKLGDLGIKIRFAEDGGKPSTQGEAIDPKTLRITFHNFVSSLGQGNIKPLEIGTVDDNKKKLFLTFRISTLNDTSLRTFEYTFYKKNA